jgi:hypothetical protein
MNPLHGEKLEKLHKWFEIRDMLGMFGMYTLLLAVAVLSRVYLKTSYFPQIMRRWMMDPTRSFVRAINGLQLTFAMCMSWCLMTAGFWTTQAVLDGTSVDDLEMAKIANAVVITIIAVFFVIAIDYIADRCGEHPGDGIIEQTPAFMRGALEGLVDVHEFSDNAERIFRTVIDAMGLLVGLCWEKATDASIETIIDGNSFLASHPVLARVGIAIVMFAFVFTAWQKYIVPKAQKTYQEHEIDLMLERALRKNPKLAMDLWATIKQRVSVVVDIDDESYARCPDPESPVISSRGTCCISTVEPRNISRGGD